MIEVLTPRDIHEAEFKRVWRGYDPEEVDEFLRRVVVEYEAVYKENERLRQRIAELEQQLQEYSRAETQIDETLALARQTAADLKEAARKEAEAAVAQARTTAQEILAEARRQAEAERVLAQRLRQEAAQYRARFERAVEEFLARLDQLGLTPGVEVLQGESAPAQVAAGLDHEAGEDA